MSEFSAARPKGDAWGVEDSIEKAMEEFMETGRTPIIPCLIGLGIKRVKTDAGPDGPEHTAVVFIARINALTTITRLRAAQAMLIEEVSARRGEGTMLPFDVKKGIDDMFAGVNLEDVEREELDAKEADEDGRLTENDRLRKHLVAVHKLDDHGLAWDGTDADVNREHERLHETPEDGAPAHDAEWLGWTRLDLETAEADGDGETPDDDAGHGDSPQFEPDADGFTDGSHGGSPHESSDESQVDPDAVPDSPAELFNDGTNGKDTQK